MKKETIMLLGMAVISMLIFWGVKAYNGLVSKEEAISGQWANVENQYQRRTDLIPNLVNTVKGYAAHESSTLEAVVAARAKATRMTISANDITPEKLSEYQASQSELSNALGRLLMVTENYPDLKANQQFIELQAQLEGTENRISVECNRFNDVARIYNTSIRRFPTVIIAGLFGFGPKPYFEATESAKAVPAVEF